MVLNGVELLLLGTPGCPKVVCVSCLDQRERYWVFVILIFCQCIINHCLVATKQLCRSAVRTNTPCGVRNVACHVQVALLLSFLRPPWCQWCSDWCALGCSAAVAFGCVGSGDTFVALKNVGAQAGCFIAAFGYKRPSCCARTSRVLEVGSQWHGCKGS